MLVRVPGKTEITFESIQYYLKQGKKVCFSISRRQVVLEITSRLQKAFPKLKIISVTQGYTDITDGDIIVCTMHQLYRYPYGFDLLIMDEVDAFPFVGNDVLRSIASLSCIGQMLYLSATPDEYSKKEIEQGNMEMITLFKRPHGFPLPIPKIIVLPYLVQIIVSLIITFKFVKKQNQVLIFVPRIEDTIILKKIYSFFIHTECVHSKSLDKDLIMEEFRNNKFDCLITTTLLERGITISNVQVIVIEADHIVFSCASLVQIFGRVGRSYNYPEGSCYCLCNNITKSIKDCIKELKKMNDSV